MFFQFECIADHLLYMHATCYSEAMRGQGFSKIKDFNGETSDRCGKIPAGYEFYLWNNDDGYNNMGDWIEAAATAAGK